MNWKVFTTLCVSTGLLFIPANSFTCGPSEDPYDYYTSFFSNRPAGKEYKPFYYTSLLTFYDEWNEDTTARQQDKVIDEWMAYGKTAKRSDAVALVYESPAEDVTGLAKAVNGATPLPSSLKANSLAQALVRDKKTGAVTYLQFAKKTAALSPASQWEEAPKRDSLAINKYLAEAASLFAKETDPFLKNKWAFQRCKVAFYNHRYTDCVRLYDEYFNEGNASAVNELALSYKAGSLFRVSKDAEAAYTFSKLFAGSYSDKKQHYLGFWWASNFADASLIPAYTALCKNNLEKANMVAMFAMFGTSYKLNEMQKVYELNPSSPLLPLLAKRDIHKLEEEYLTPTLVKEKGGKALYTSFADLREEGGKAKSSLQTQATKTSVFFSKLSDDKSVANKSLYSLGAAYLLYTTKDYEGAKATLAKVKEAQTDAASKDQTQLINLLIATSELKAVSKESEAGLLPLMKWLVQKAKSDEEYRPFCRNFFSEILAQKYEQQGDGSRAALAYALADMGFVRVNTSEDSYFYPQAIDYVRTDLNTEALLNLYNVMTTPQSESEKFFVQNASFKRDAVVDVIGTSHLRDRDYAKAIDWFGKAARPEPMMETQYNYDTGKETKIAVNPLYDYLNDWQRYGKSSSTPYTKLSLAKKLLELKTTIDGTDTVADKAKLYYTYATALYNMSYYGNAWNAVAYDRSSVDWNEGNYKLAWQKEYYSVYEARTYYQKAYDAAVNKEYKAACLFMVIKCAQRQLVRPGYDYKNEATSEKAAKAFEKQFKYNPLFQKFKTEFGTTKFYQYAYNRCSYLRDYVMKGNTQSSTSSKPKK